MMVYTCTINGLLVQTGDIICTTDGEEGIFPGQFWRLIGKLVPGAVDHIVIYVGPRGHCVEAGAKGVIAFEVEGNVWVAEEMREQRGQLIDTLYGVAYPLRDKGFPEEEEREIRSSVANYCLAQVAANKPYNLNFLN